MLATHGRDWTEKFNFTKRSILLTDSEEMVVKMFFDTVDDNIQETPGEAAAPPDSPAKTPSAQPKKNENKKISKK